jgi:hypothetical protein
MVKAPRNSFMSTVCGSTVHGYSLSRQQHVVDPARKRRRTSRDDVMQLHDIIEHSCEPEYPTVSVPSQILERLFPEHNVQSLLTLSRDQLIAILIPPGSRRVPSPHSRESDMNQEGNISRPLVADSPDSPSVQHVCGPLLYYYSKGDVSHIKR